MYNYYTTTKNNSTYRAFGVVLVLALLCFQDGAGKCIHDEMMQKEMKKRNTLASVLQVAPQQYGGETYPTNSNTGALRISFDFSSLANDPFTCYSAGSSVYLDSSTTYTCKASDVLSADQKTLLTQTLLPAAAQLLASALKVIRPQGNLILTGSKCGYGPQVTLNSTYTGAGIPDTDLVLFVTSRPITTAGVIALGSPCLEDQIGRPVAGQLNFNPAYVTVDSQYEAQLGTSLHEITHVLGFTSVKLGNLNTIDSSQSKSAYTTSQAAVGASGTMRDVTKVTTPAVVDWARTHFGCSSLDGAELEDGGGTGTKGSHWEKRLFYNEYMTGESSGNPVFSGITLALLQDSGWYHVNYEAADRLIWGSGQGCNFVQKPCSSWDTELGYFCSTTTKVPQCSIDLQAKAGCTITTFLSSDTNPPPPPTSAQYFSNPLLGGDDVLLDYCPTMEPYSNGWCTDTSLSSSNDDQYSQVYSNTSRCFMSSVTSSLTPVSRQAMCFPTYCTSPTKLKVLVGGIWYDCKDGADLEPHSGYSGSFTCPTTSVLCTGAAEDNTWPTVKSVSPSHGGPGDVVTITGTNFNEYTIATIYVPCESVTFIDNTTIVATLATTGVFRSLKAVAGKYVDVVVGDNRTGHNSFLSWGFKINTSATLIAQSISWLKSHVWAPAVFGALVLVTCLGCCIKRRNNKKNKVNPEGGKRRKKGSKRSKKGSRRRKHEEEEQELEENYATGQPQDEEMARPREVEKQLPRQQSTLPPLRHPQQQLPPNPPMDPRQLPINPPVDPRNPPQRTHSLIPAGAPMRTVSNPNYPPLRMNSQQHYAPAPPQGNYYSDAEVHPARGPYRQPPPPQAQYYDEEGYPRGPQRPPPQQYYDPNAYYTHYMPQPSQGYYSDPTPQAHPHPRPHPPPGARKSNLYHPPPHQLPGRQQAGPAEYADEGYGQEYNQYYDQRYGKYDYA